LKQIENETSEESQLLSSHTYLTATMGSLVVRDEILFPPGDNLTDTFIGGTHFNRTILDIWDYVLYTNDTISNISHCYLVFRPFTPTALLANGTFLNSTWCYDPVRPIGPRAGISAGVAIIYAVALIFNIVSLRKHSKARLPPEKRFRIIGRRFQWYWAILVCIVAFISLFTNVDVDRYFLPELPLILTSFSWYILQFLTLALVWEASRHWGSWMERQYIDPDPFALGQDDKRARVELVIPLAFYGFLALVSLERLEKTSGRFSYSLKQLGRVSRFGS
jgi:hypothetical protein